MWGSHVHRWSFIFHIRISSFCLNFSWLSLKQVSGPKYTYRMLNHVKPCDRKALHSKTNLKKYYPMTNVFFSSCRFVLQPSALHQPSASTFSSHTITHLNTHTQCATGGHHSPLGKLGQGVVGKRRGSVIIFIIINFHLKVTPGLGFFFFFLSASILISTPLQTCTHRYQDLWKSCVPNKSEQRVGDTKRKDLKGTEWAWYKRRGDSRGRGGRRVGCIALSLTEH